MASMAKKITPANAIHYYHEQDTQHVSVDHGNHDHVLSVPMSFSLAALSEKYSAETIDDILQSIKTHATFVAI